jgi:predicted lipid-binding transport protein (Tim44 family)
MNRWKAAGGAGRHVDDALWTRFRAIQDNFFNRRSEVFTAQDEEFQGNLVAKTDLLAKAEAEILPVKDVAAARTAYRDFVQAFNAIGRVPSDHVRAVDARVRAIESAIDEADKREWARTDPQTRARAQETVNLFSAQIDKLKDQLAKAETKGDKSQISKTTASIATYQIWLDQAQQTLDDLNA